MDPRLLGQYSRELEHLRSTAAEFGRAFPKIAGRLGLGEFECADPYVERLLEGFAFLAARIQLRFDEGFPALAESLLDVLAPGLLAPVPAMAVVRFVPDPAHPALGTCVRIPRGTVLTGRTPAGETTAPEFRTAADCTLLPFALAEAGYHTRDPGVKDPPPGIAWSSALRLRLEPLGPAAWDACTADALTLHILGADETAWSLHELVHSAARGVVVDDADGRRLAVLGPEAVAMPGLAADEAMLPVTPQGSQGSRLLQEYFACPDRFCALTVRGLRDALRACRGRPLQITILLGERREQLVRVVDAQRLALHAVPVVNLFPRRADRIPVDGRRHEFHLVPDRLHPADYEIHSVLGIEAYGEDGRPLFTADPFAAVAADGEHEARFSPHRRPAASTRRGSGYQASEVVALLAGRAFDRSDGAVGQIGARLLCTNRDLVPAMPVGDGSDFAVPAGVPASAVRCLHGPTAPIPAATGQDAAWRAIACLRQDHLALAAGGGDAAAALRGLIDLHARGKPAAAARQAQALTALRLADVVRRLPGAGPITYGRGLAAELVFDDQPFQGGTCLPLGRILAELLCDQVSVGSFVETVLTTSQRGAIVRWPPRTGSSSLL